MGGQPQTAGTAFEPTTWQHQLQNYKQLEGQDAAWRTAEGSPWKPAEPAGWAKMVGDALASKPGQRFMDLANFLGPGPKMPPRGIKAFHGSPHDFDRFDLSKIGTGEGAQAYGHGLYFAEAETVAKNYRDMLGKSMIEVDGKRRMPAELSEHLWKQSGKDSPEFLKGVMDAVQEMTVTGKVPAAPADLAGWMGYGPMPQREGYAYAASQLANAKATPGGRMYEVNIKADSADFLDWDAPLSQQSEKVRGAIKGLGWEPKVKGAFDDATLAGFEQRANEARAAYDKLRADYFEDAWKNPRKSEAEFNQLPEAYRLQSEILKAHDDINRVMRAREAFSGKGIVQNMTDDRAMGQTGQLAAEAVSKKLLEQGIPGIRYKDAGSRDGPGGTSNYVVFDDKLVDIVRKYGLAALLMGGAATAGSGDGNAAP